MDLRITSTLREQTTTFTAQPDGPPGSGGEQTILLQQEAAGDAAPGDPVRAVCRTTPAGVEVTLWPGAPPVLVRWPAGAEPGPDGTHAAEVEGQEVQLRALQAASRPGRPKPSPHRPAAAPPKTPAGASGAATLPGGVYPPMPGSIVKVAVAVGDRVQAGDLLLILEAMKMQNEIHAPRAGRVLQVGVTPGQKADRTTLLVELGE